MEQGQIRIGISGWRYKGWRGTFYPTSLRQADELAFASRLFSSVEINGTFYSFQTPERFRRWYDSTPVDFVFSVKASRYITHLKRLKDIDEPLERFFSSGVLELKEKLGPILWQFPPSMRFDPDKFERFFSKLPRNFYEAGSEGTSEKIRHAIEIRNDSFLNPWFVELARSYSLAIVFADTAGRWPYIEDITGDFIYIRLHGDSELYFSGYGEEALDFWAKRISTWSQGKGARDQLSLSSLRPPTIPRDVFAYFDNDAKVRAPFDAIELTRKTRRTYAPNENYPDLDALTPDWSTPLDGL